MEKTKFKWSTQATFLAEKANFTADDIRMCEKYAEEKLFIIGGQHILDWLNWKFNKGNNPTPNPTKHASKFSRKSWRRHFGLGS